jgi:16S rRNA (cytidine1402-2'-O)-methyltransferase
MVLIAEDENDLFEPTTANIDIKTPIMNPRRDITGTNSPRRSVQSKASARSDTRATEPAKRRDRKNALAAGLYLVATPIGNLRDISLRALDVLSQADVIACEDTRVTSKLMSAYDIDTKLIAYHEHNAARARPQIMARLARGEIVALVSDAGTPLISDPGYKLVREARDAGHTVTAIPGASAVLAAVSVSGLPTDRFYFGGFVPSKSGQRQRFFAEIGSVPSTIILFETAPRLAASLSAAAKALGDRPAVVARELTKKFEQCRAGSLAELATHYADAGPPKGEIVLVIGPPTSETGQIDALGLDAKLREAMADHSVRDAVDRVAVETGLPRRQVYRHALTIDNSED